MMSTFWFIDVDKLWKERAVDKRNELTDGKNNEQVDETSRQIDK